MNTARILVAAVGLAYMAAAGPAAAATERPSEAEPQADIDVDQAARLDDLFARLQSAAGASEGQDIADAIVGIWHQSGDPSVDRLMRLTLATMETGNYRMALVFLDQMIALKPNFAEGWNKRATVYYLINDFAKSMADIEKTLTLEPRHFGALAGIGMIMEQTGNKDAAIAAFKQALAINPSMDNIREAIRRLEADLRRDAI